MSRRVVRKKYQDPLEIVWIHCANELGIKIKRDDEVFASWDGRGTLRIGQDSLDEDDSLAQIILHELCHVFVEGPEAFDLPDWGLNDPIAKPRVHEFATLRLQAYLADLHGLRTFFSSTTDFCEYYAALPNDPIGESISCAVPFKIIRPVTPEEDHQAMEMATQGRHAWTNSKWVQAIDESLRLTAEIRRLVSGRTAYDSLWTEA